ncbi:MAG: 23S rRNA (guanosine(2251)-2'-O)-methyltransferase RlmB [Angustibacter sp.]
MSGNSRRRGAVRKGSSRKGPLVGSGGQRRKALRGKGPTPKADERPGHSASRRGSVSGGAAAQQRSAEPRSGARRRPAADGAGRQPGRPGSEVVAGRNGVVEALRAQVPVTTLYVAHRVEADDRVREAVAVAHERGIPVLETPRGELDRLTGGAVHQGLAVQVPAYQYAHPADLLGAADDAGQAPLLVALDGITDPRNLGAVVRSVAAFGGHGVIVPQRRAAGMTAAAWRTSAGAAARLPVAQATNLTRALQDLQRAGCFVVGLDADADVTLADVAVVHEPLVLVIGSEGRGLSRLVRETCDVVTAIPIHAATESLNAGVAAGIALYDVARRRGDDTRRTASYG